MSTVLDAQELVKSYEGRRVVDGLSLSCSHSTVLGLLGPNGAGKTTTLRMLYGLIEPEHGSIRYEGRDFRAHRTEIKRTIGVCTQEDTLDYDLTVSGNLRVYASYFRPKVPNLESRIQSLLKQFDLTAHEKRSPRELSGGMKKRLMIARSLIHEPTILFLDEPTTGLDPKARVEVWELIHTMRTQGMGIVLTTHYMDEAERLSDQLLVISEGKRLTQGTPSSVLGNLIGEHVLVIASHEPEQKTVQAWLDEQHIKGATSVLSELQVPLSSEQLARFTERFRSLRFSVRSPNLDDLFLRLSEAPRKTQ